MAVQDEIKQYAVDICNGVGPIEWELIDRRFTQFQAQAGVDADLTQLIQESKDQVELCRRKQFNKEKDEIEAMLRAETLPPEEDFRARLTRLSKLAEPVYAFKEQPNRLRVEYSRRSELSRLEKEKDKAVTRYYASIESGTDMVVAAEQYLKPILEKAQEVLNYLPDDPRVIKLLEDIRRTIRESDRTDTHTNATQGKFKAILDNLYQKDSNYREALVDEFGQSHGVRTRDEAVRWYENRAKLYAEEKASEYRTRAEDALQRNNPRIAQRELDEANKLFLLPPPVRKDLDAFEEKYIMPLLKRIDYAESEFNLVIASLSLEDALTHYNNAIDPGKGWPYFETTMENEDSVGASALNPAKRARTYIVELLDRFFDNRVRLLNMDTNAQNILTRLTSDDMQKMTRYVDWDRQLSEKYSTKVIQLREMHAQATQNLSQIEASKERARQFLSENKHQQAHSELSKWADIINANPEKFRDAHRLLEQTKALSDIRGERDRLEQVVNSSVNWDNAEQEITRIKEKIEVANRVINDRPSEATNVDMHSVRDGLQYLVMMLEAYHLYNKQHQLEAALDIWRRIPQDSRFHEQAEQYIEQVSSQLQDDNALNSAINQAYTYQDNQDYESMYHVLIPHHEKYHARDYQTLTGLLETARERYGQQVIQAIRQNIADNKKNPEDLKALRQQLRIVNPRLAAQHDKMIERGLIQQQAWQAYEVAKGTTNRERWEDALQKFEELNSYETQPKLGEVREQYTFAFVIETIQNTSASNIDLNIVETQLTKATDEIHRLEQDYAQSTVVNELKLRVFNRFMQIAQSPDVLSRYRIQSISMLDRLDPSHADYQTYIDQIQLAEDVVQAAEAVRSAYVPKQRLQEWLNAEKRWQQISSVSQQYSGIQRWYNEFVSTKVLVSLDAEATEREQNISHKWHLLDPLSKRYLVTKQSVGDVWEYVEELRQSAQIIVADYTGSETLDFGEQSETLIALERATWALNYLTNPDRRLQVSGISTDSFVMNVSEITDLFEYSAQLALTIGEKAREVQEVKQILAIAKGRLNNAVNDGSFNRVDEALKPIESGHLKDYQVNNEYRALKIECNEKAKEVRRFDTILDEINTLFVDEQFDEVTNKLNILEADPQADAYDIIENVTTTDRFKNNSILRSVRAIRLAVKEKSEQIRALITWLDDIVDETVLIQCIKDDDEKLRQAIIFDLESTKVVNFHHADNSTIQKNRNIGRYDLALQALTDVDFGGQENQLTPHPSGKLSIAQAQSILSKPPISPKNCISDTAISIMQWANALWTQLADDALCIQARYNDLYDADEAFAEALTNFNEATIDMKSNRRKHLNQMQSAYKRITGRDSPGDSVLTNYSNKTKQQSGCHYELEPLATDFTELDATFTRLTSKGS